MHRPDPSHHGRRGTLPIRRRAGRAGTIVVVAMALLGIARTIPGHGAQEAGISDAEFWSIFSTKSERGGSFASENFVSNEVNFQEVIPSIQRTLTPGGVYIGVGPEQNFTYIANLQPRLAFIIDIRRQNAMQHLMFKALFELSPTRAEFVSRLFSRPFTLLGAGVAPAVLFDSAEARAPSDSAWRANLDAITGRLTGTRGFALSLDDLESLTHVYQVFYEAGPAVNYGYRPGNAATLFRTRYPTFGDLQSATNADSVPMAFLASDENYRTIREMHLQNRIIPVVGDFGGPTAIRAVGDYLWQRGMTVTAFYLSNVEQYLFRERGKADAFYGNVASLPTDSTSTFIRSVPPGGAGPALTFMPGSPAVRFGGGGGAISSSFSITIRDSAGVRIMRTMQDSAGSPVTRVFVDSAGQLVPLASGRDSTRTDSLLYTVTRDSLVASALRSFVRMDSMRALPRAAVGGLPTMVMGSLLTSGTAPIRETIDRALAGELRTYQDVIDMTKTRGWK